jgi:putative heme transporter
VPSPPSGREGPPHDRETTQTPPAEASTAGPSVPASPPPATPRSGSRPIEPPRVDRSAVIGEGLKATAAWSLRLIIIAVALALLLWLLGQVWVGIRPILLALILSTVLWPAVAWLRRHRWPPALAAGTVLVGALLAVVGVLALVTQPMVSQAIELADRAVTGIEQVQDWLTGPPVNLASERIDAVAAEVTGRLRNSASQIAAGVFSGVSVVTSGLVTLVLVLVLAFFFIKDGPAFLPWLRREAGPTIGGHLTEVLARSWRTLGDFIRVQAIVSFVDALFIGLGLIILGIPLAPALAVLTFFAGFIPIVGALAAGVLAVLIALVSNGPTTALIVLAIIVAVQQLESNVLQPVLQGRTLNLHAAIVLLSVTAGGTLFGIIGAFLAVPLAAVTAAVLRYVSEQISLRTGEVHANEIQTTTPEGSRAARQGEQAGRRFRWRAAPRRDSPEP